MYANRVNAMKQSVESALGGCVVLNLVECTTNDQWRYCGFYIGSGAEANYDLYDLSGWTPDYGDPETYLNTFLPDYEGFMSMCIGLF